VHFAVDERNLGTRTASDETEARPALAVLDRFEQEPRRVTDEREKRTDGSVAIGEYFGPHGHHAVRCRECAELFAAGRDAHATA